MGRHEYCAQGDDSCSSATSATNLVAAGTLLGLFGALPWSIGVLVMRKVSVVVGLVGVALSITPALITFLVVTNEYSRFTCTS